MVIINSEAGKKEKEMHWWQVAFQDSETICMIFRIVQLFFINEYM